MKLDITIGSRVRLSPLGAERCPSLADKFGTVVGGSVYNNSVSVRFDGNKSSITLHQNYLEVVGGVPDSIANPTDSDQKTDG